MSKHWEATGPIRDEIHAAMMCKKAALKSLFKLVKEFGAETVATRESMGIAAVMVFATPPDLKLWKPVKGGCKQYSPRLSSKEGKAIEKKIEDACYLYPSGEQMGKIIGLPLFGGGDDEGGLRWYTPGVSVVGKRVLVRTPNHYVPPKDKAKWMKRISDIEFERAVDGKKAKVAV